MLVSYTVLQVGVLGCKSGLAVLLLAAGGAKVADLRGFAGSVRLFLPSATSTLALRLSGVIAGVIACGELAVGAASLALPGVRWLGWAVAVVCVGFLATWTAGYARHRGRPCRCFGALSRRGFSGAGVLRAGGLVLAALAALARVPVSSVQLGQGARAGLLAGAVLVAAAAFSAAAAAGRLLADSAERA
ncbi:MAG TPA: MauE/DoxX family redox-associated membrane protein [Streptosporangiaceae bacterium]|nr:MauE/DoxX family redox-associated membrane protein [Streptosporangiaceae bacterium]